MMVRVVPSHSNLYLSFSVISLLDDDGPCRAVTFKLVLVILSDLLALFHPLDVAAGGQVDGDLDILSNRSAGVRRKPCHKVDLGLLHFESRLAFLVTKGAGDLPGVDNLHVVQLKSLLLSLDDQLDVLVEFDFLPLPEPLGLGVSLADLNLEDCLLATSGPHCGQSLGEFWRQLHNRDFTRTLLVSNRAYILSFMMHCGLLNDERMLLPLPLQFVTLLSGVLNHLTILVPFDVGVL